ncbi:DUF6086 family protein [Streptomyces sp. UG1]|uniref:DUF6086 family protein n=1 Tax=Streptomyces sp. UG1 TaxID=3417652 RepID=UPI003CEBC41A
MSCYVMIADRDVWNPANQVAEVFVGQVGIASRILGVDSGVEPIVEDECHIDAEKFEAFTSVLSAAVQRTNNLAFRGMLQGILEVCAVLVSRAGGSISPAVDVPDSLPRTMPGFE